MLLLPAAAERFVDLHQGEQFVEPSLREAEFGGQVVGFVGEHFEVIRGAGLVTLSGKLRRILGGVSQEFLLRAEFLIFLIGDQGVGNVAKRALNRLLVGQDGFLLLRLGQAHVRAKFSGIENRLRDAFRQTSTDRTSR